MESPRDGIVRAVLVQTENGLLRRAIQRLHPLEVPSELENDNQQEDQSVQQEEDELEQPVQPEEVDAPVDNIVPLPEVSVEQEDNPDPTSLPAREDVRTRTGRLTRVPRHLVDFVLVIN